MDAYTWNNPHDIGRKQIESFLEIAEQRLEPQPLGRGAPVPFSLREGRRVIAWLRALLERKPSEMKT